MASIATFIAIMAAAGALASWVAGGVFYTRALRERGDRAWLPALVWPFATARVRGSAGAAQVNKALVAFLTCAMIGAAATSVATNLHRMAK